jgi:hypothetical protein
VWCNFTHCVRQVLNSGHETLKLYTFCTTSPRQSNWIKWNGCETLPLTLREEKGDKKLKLSLCFNWAPRHKDVLGEWRYRSTQCLTSALDGRKWSASLPGRFTHRERTPGTHWIGGWVGPRAGLDTVSKRKILTSCRDSNLEHPARS